MRVDRGRPCTCTSLTLSSLPFYLSSFCILSLWSTSGNFQHKVSSLISKRLPGSLTTTSARLCYHLPRVYQLQTQTESLAKVLGAPLSKHASLRWWVWALVHPRQWLPWRVEGGTGALEISSQAPSSRWLSLKLCASPNAQLWEILTPTITSYQPHIQLHGI